MAKILFIPVSVISGLIAGFLARTLFAAIWSRIDDAEPPDPNDRDADWQKLALAMAAEGAVFGITRGLVDHAARRAFYNATGAWPGEEEPEEA
jgi:hypothetical protein